MTTMMMAARRLARMAYVRPLTTATAAASQPPAAEDAIQKSVFISQSTDVHENLALEEWLYKNFDFASHHVLMLWQNGPSVVIGRHQNPWLESDVVAGAENGVKLARRNSGGGAVYHDMGNLNMTFFTPRQHYSRRYNLDVVTRAVFREYGVRLDATDREDLVLRNHFKVSGTASKLGRPNAYHHCTLLVRVNKVNLSQALKKTDMTIKTNATKSISSPVMNICEDNPGVKVENLLGAIGWEYLRTPALHVQDGGKQQIAKQKGFHLINPSEQWFPGITEMKRNLSSWDWCFGRTPDFSVRRSFSVPTHLLNPDMYSSTQLLEVTMQVEKGRVRDVSVTIPPGLSKNGFCGEARILTDLTDCKFTEESLSRLELSLNGADVEHTIDKDKFVADCVRHVMTSS